MLVVRVILVVLILLVAVAVQPALWPFALAGVLIALIAGAWAGSSRGVNASATAVILIAGAVVGAIALQSGFKGSFFRHGVGAAPTPISVLYVAHLTLSHTKDLEVREYIAISAEPGVSGFVRRMKRRLRAQKWVPGPLKTELTRSGSKRLDVPSLFPAERRIHFEFPRPNDLGPFVLLDPESRVVLDGPANSITDTFPDARQQRGPNGGVRFSLNVGEAFSDPIDFEVRSPPFRNHYLLNALDVIKSNLFHWLVVVLPGLAWTRVRLFLARKIKRLFKRRRDGHR